MSILHWQLLVHASCLLTLREQPLQENSCQNTATNLCTYLLSHGKQWCMANPICMAQVTNSSSKVNIAIMPMSCIFLHSTMSTIAVMYGTAVVRSGHLKWSITVTSAVCPSKVL